MKGAVISVSLIVLGFLGGLLGGSDILGFISNYFKEKTEKKEREKSKKLKELNDQWHNLYEQLAIYIEFIHEKMVFTEFNPTDIEKNLIKIENRTIHKLDEELMRMQVGLFGNPSSFSRDNLATFLQSIKNKIDELKEEIRKLEN
jgi:gas vesicle protein